eukprot:7289163-Pyramimonas_sp.AAC.1
MAGYGRITPLLEHDCYSTVLRLLQCHRYSTTVPDYYNSARCGSGVFLLQYCRTFAAGSSRLLSNEYCTR